MARADLAALTEARAIATRPATSVPIMVKKRAAGLSIGLE
jgi:hypothetical protein